MSRRLYNVGIYVRLSQESKNYRGIEESFSIENQIAVLEKFVDMTPGWSRTRIYVDDGASGANFNRRGFQDMMEDVRQGRINLVLVKDLSRFGRNYLETGRLLEEELPALGCRFVALSDVIDTQTGENDILPFLNAVNDFHIREVSERVKSVFAAKAKDGHKLTGVAPYGYDRDLNDRTRLSTDEYAAGNVRRMFALRAQGMGYSAIAGAFNKDGILPPRLYYYKRQGRETKAVCIGVWTTRTVKLMLNNEIYIGSTVSMKRGARSYRDSREYRRDESEWIKAGDTHAPIVDIKTWDKVQKLNQAAKAKMEHCKPPRPNPFAGLLICSDCKTKMNRIKRTYVCSVYQRSGGTACSNHRLSENNLKALALEHIQKIAGQLDIDRHAMLINIRERLTERYKSDNSDTEKRQRMTEQKLYTLENQRDRLYEDKVYGIISAETFCTLASDIEKRQIQAENELERMRQLSQKTAEKLNGIANLIEESSALHEIDRELLESLIDKIEIGAQIMLDGRPAQELRIFYKHAGL